MELTNAYSNKVLLEPHINGLGGATSQYESRLQGGKSRRRKRGSKKRKTKRRSMKCKLCNRWLL
jgi:hypothetical protein